MSKFLQAATQQVDLLATTRTLDIDTRARSLAALSQRIDGHVRRLANEVQAGNERALGINPVSQADRD